MSGCFEVSSRYDFECFSDVDDERSGFVLHRLPLLMPSEDVQRRHWDTEEKCQAAIVGVAVHSDSFSPCAIFRRQRKEAGVPEVPGPWSQKGEQVSEYEGTC